MNLLTTKQVREVVKCSNPFLHNLIRKKTRKSSFRGPIVPITKEVNGQGHGSHGFNLNDTLIVAVLHRSRPILGHGPLVQFLKKHNLETCGILLWEVTGIAVKIDIPLIRKQILESIEHA
jgi:hypothetical protein